VNKIVEFSSVHPNPAAIHGWSECIHHVTGMNLGKGNFEPVAAPNT